MEIILFVLVLEARFVGLELLPAQPGLEAKSESEMFQGISKEPRGKKRAENRCDGESIHEIQR